ncbi:MAG: TlyA family RNA methyltransferase [Pseudomonadota bacterium]
MSARQRLDTVLHVLGHYATRARARDAIQRGCVQVAGVPAVKAGQRVSPDDTITIDDPARAYVSRAGFKLEHALARFGFDATGHVAVDVGASTGGFTQVLLAQGAALVHAIDVGQGQLHASLRDDPRVRLREGCDARALTAADLSPPPSVLVADVSFISLTKVLGVPLSLLVDPRWLVVLVKPQFEVGRAHIGKGGLVTSAEATTAAVARVRAHIEEHTRWRCSAPFASPLPGGDGNQEWLIGAVYDG